MTVWIGSCSTPTTRWVTTRAGSGSGGGGCTANDEQLDNAHLMRMAGRFARRVRASANAHGIPVIDCKRGERKHQIAEEYLATPPVERGVFLILVARAVGPGVGGHPLAEWSARATWPRRRAFVNHYSFHIMDPQWGHMTIKMSGHPPFGAQVILNGHEYVAATARAAGSDTSRRATASPASPTPPPWLRSQTPCRSPRR